MKLPLKFRLVCRRPRWVLTAQGWIIALLTSGLLSIGVLTNLHPFLAVTAPIPADALVVEGWLNDLMLRPAITEFQRGNYKLLITTGGPLYQGSYLVHKTHAELAAATLQVLGVDAADIGIVSAELVDRDRTYAAALALKEWLSKSPVSIKTVNVYTAGVHARRSWVLYRRALAPEVKVGIFAAQPGDYDTQYWWASSAGMKTVVYEAIGYVYARLFNAT